MNSIKIIMLIAVIAMLATACGPGLPRTSDYNLRVAGQPVYGVHRETDSRHDTTNVDCATRMDCGGATMVMGQGFNPANAVTSLQNATMSRASYNRDAMKCDLYEVVYDGKVVKVLPDGCRPADAREMEMVPTR
ncbi:MAG: hypothetical protein PHC53_04635 [Patescibacteria group bacterium]|nr:hypothetical protein [Patescibacteria group bacterium]